VGCLAPEAGVRVGRRVCHGPSTETYLLDASATVRHHIFFGASPGLIAGLIREVSG